MKQEIERKYAIEYLPKELDIESIVNIEQAFIYKDINTIIRIRKIEEKKPTQKQFYIYTVKTKGDIQYDNEYNIARKYEIETEITKEEYENLINKKISNIINKTRITTIISDNKMIEIDIYDDYLEGLLTAEVEFENEEEAQKFIKPDWLGKEIGYKELSNRKLAEMTRQEWKEKVTKEIITNNEKIIKQLQENYQI